MNKKEIIILTLIVFVSAFGTGAYLHQKDAPNKAIETNEVPSTKTAATTEENSLIRAHSPVMGSINAPVTIIEFLDPACEACRAYFPYVEAIRQQYPNDVRVAYRFVPFHRASLDAVKILLAANAQGVFHPVMEGLFETQSEWSPHASQPNIDRAWDVAKLKGIDVEKAKRDIQEAKVQEIIAQEKSDMRFFKIRQTPTFFVNGQQMQLSSPTELNNIVADAVQKAQTKSN